MVKAAIILLMVTSGALTAGAGTIARGNRPMETGSSDAISPIEMIPVGNGMMAGSDALTAGIFGPTFLLSGSESGEAPVPGPFVFAGLGIVVGLVGRHLSRRRKAQHRG